MAPDSSPFVVLAQQGAEVANLIVIEKLTNVSRREPSIGGNDQARRARSEVVSSISPNHRLSEHDTWRRITQSRAAREYGCERDDLHNVIEDRRCLRSKTPSPP
jgi:hypothetical protein